MLIFLTSSFIIYITDIIIIPELVALLREPIEVMNIKLLSCLWDTVLTMKNLVVTLTREVTVGVESRVKFLEDKTR